MGLRVRKISVPAAVNKPVRLAVVADLHGCDGSAVCERLEALRPDAILVPGDLCDDLVCTPDDAAEHTGRRARERDRGFAFLRRAARIAPTFYTPGNHEINLCGRMLSKWSRARIKGKKLSPGSAAAVRAAGAILLENEEVAFGELTIGGLLPGEDRGDPDLSWTEGFCAAPGFRVLLCHQPEYYPKFLRSLPIDLIVSGHAHGGQWRAFGRGLYAPGQGLFPKYTSGLYEGRLAVSAGVGDHTRVPRFGNPHEILLLELCPKD